MKRDWNSYIGTKNKYGVKILRFEKEEEKHSAFSKVICVCPNCKKEFVVELKKVLYEDKRQVKVCPICSRKNDGDKKKVYKFNIGDILNNNLEVLDIYYKKGTQHASVKCLKCGNIFESCSCNLTSKTKPVTMCPKCSKKNVADKKMKDNEIEPGTKSFLLTVIKSGNPVVINEKGWRMATVICRCECGNICTVRAAGFKLGKIKSCGCLRSWLEAQTAKFLTLNGIHFTHGLRFPDILTDNGNPVEFDFQIEDEFNNHICFIECQGEQHYKDGDFGRQQREETDIKKKNYCTKHNIILYEIRYDDDMEQRVREILTELNLI